MVKVIEALSDAQDKRVEEGRGTKLDKAMYNWAEKSVQKHPKFTKFIVDHKNQNDIAMDILLTADLIFLGYNIGKISMAKDICACRPADLKSELSGDGKVLSLYAKSVTPKGIPVTNKINTSNKTALMDLANKAIEALHNNGVDFHTI